MGMGLQVFLVLFSISKDYIIVITIIIFYVRVRLSIVFGYPLMMINMIISIINVLKTFMP